MKQFTSDARRKARGGRSQMLELCCAKCGTKFFHYQKDGPGPLLRLYLDRIKAPARFVGLEKKALSALKVLDCKTCGRLLAMPAIYKPEKRKSYRLFQGAFAKRRVRLDESF